jgi:hypothetical protein
LPPCGRDAGWDVSDLRAAIAGVPLPHRVGDLGAAGADLLDSDDGPLPGIPGRLAEQLEGVGVAGYPVDELLDGVGVEDHPGVVEPAERHQRFPDPPVIQRAQRHQPELALSYQGSASVMAMALAIASSSSSAVCG